MKGTTRISCLAGPTWAVSFKVAPKNVFVLFSCGHLPPSARSLRVRQLRDLPNMGVVADVVPTARASGNFCRSPSRIAGWHLAIETIYEREETVWILRPPPALIRGPAASVAAFGAL